MNLNANFPLRDKGVSNALAVESLPRHRWYFVKEGFSPELVDHAILSEELGPRDLLIDPFTGGGTTPLAGVASDLHVQGYELNPFLCLVARSKLASPGAQGFVKSAGRVLAAAEKQVESPLEGFSTFTSGNAWGRWLFPRAVLRTFQAAKQSLAKQPVQHRGLLKLALIGAAMDCCNAKRDGKCLRYRADWQHHQAKPTTFRERFAIRTDQMGKDLEEASLPSDRVARIWKGDSRRLVSLHRERFRLCVTSPPYLNSFDYSDVYRPELFLGDFVDSTESLMRIRLATVRSHLQANWVRPRRSDFGSLYVDCVRELNARADALWSPKLPTMVQAYFEDMKAMLTRLRRRAASKASLWLVVSTSAYAGVEVPVDLILADIGQRVGWYLREIGVLRYLRSSSQHVTHVQDPSRKPIPLRESVVIFDNSR